MMAGSLFALTDLSVDHVHEGERRRLVDGVELAVEPGEIYGIVGESGSGKSLSIMASVGLTAGGLEVIGGTVTFAGRELPARDQAGLRRNLAHGVSLLFQNAKGALNPFFTVRRQIARALASQGNKAGSDYDRVRDLLIAVGLDPGQIASKYAHQLSGGQAQRVAMACALATRPRLLMADEPTTALDVTTEREVLDLLVALCRDRGLAVVLVTHNLALVSQYCGRVSVMHAGNVVETGSVREVFARPLHPYTQGLLAAIPDVDAPRELVPLEGSVWGGGFSRERCRFSHRCVEARRSCTSQRPPVVRFDDHAVRCVIYGSEPA
jgi:oligopeptide/dipeptide ABC transporter ATP-binding protein